MKICIWTGASWEAWGPPSLDSGGIGGSETAAIHVGFELAKLGHEVELHGQHEGFEGYWTPAVGGGAMKLESVEGQRFVARYHPDHSPVVRYLHFQKAIDDPKTIDCDVLVASRDKRTLRLPFKTRARVLWVHDVHVGDDWEHEVGRHDLIYALSDWHKGLMVGLYEDVPPHKFKVTRNGIDPARFALGRADGQTGRRADGQTCGQCGGTGKMKIQAGGFLVDDPLCSGSGRLLVSSSARLRALKRPHFVYSSSPDRGLDVLLDVWPEVRKLHDDAQLHVYYGFDNWKKLNAVNKRGLIIIEHMESRVRGKELEQIYYHGRVGQHELAAAHLKSMVWAYPTNFSETYCISALEAQAAGAVPVTTRIAALAETVKCGTLLDPGNKTPRYKAELLAAIAQQLAVWERGEAPSSREWALAQTWEGVARGWADDFVQILEGQDR